MKTIKNSLLVLFVWLSFSSLTQTDEILNQLKEHPTHDLIRCQLLNDYIDLEFDLEKWNPKNDELLSISQSKFLTEKNKQKKKKYAHFLAVSLNNKGAYFAYLGDNKKSIQYYRKSLSIAEKFKDWEQISIANQNIGVAYEKLGKLDSNLFYHKKAWEAIKDHGTNADKGYVLTDIAYTFKIIGDYRSAIDYNLQSLRYFLKSNDKEGTERCYFTMARIFQDQNEAEKAIEYYLKCWRLAKEINNTERLSLIEDALATCYLRINQIQKAKYYNQKSLETTELLGIPERKVFALITLGNIEYKEAKNPTQTYETAYQLCKSSEFIQGQIKCANLLAEYFLESNQLEKAKRFAEEGFNLSKEFKNPQDIINSGNVLKSIYLTNKQFEKVVEIQEIIAQNSKILNDDKNRNIALKKEFDYQNKLQKEQINQLDKDIQIKELNSKRKTNLLFLIIAIFLLAMVLVGFIFSRYRSKKQTQLLRIQLQSTQDLLVEKQKASESEIKAIKSQLNPHFFYNALNSIQGYILTGEQQKASDAIGLFSEMSRSVLENSRANEISLQDEIDLLTTYLQLEKMRMPKIEYSIECDEETYDFDPYLPPMLLQPIVENSVKHGLANKQDGGEISIRFSILNKHILQITIDDTGVGREAAAKNSLLKVRKGSSFSTEANQQRIDLLNERYGWNISMEIIDKKTDTGMASGTQVIVLIPQENFE